MSPQFTKEQLDAIAVIGLRAYESGRNSDARAIFEGLIRLDDSLYYGFAGLGAVDLREGNLPGALDNLRKAADRNPNDAGVHTNLGETLLRMTRFQDSAMEFRKAMELDPAGLDPGANRARAILDGIEAALRTLRTTAAGS